MNSEPAHLIHRRNSYLITGFAICLALFAILDGVKLARLPEAQYAIIFPLVLVAFLFTPFLSKELYRELSENYSLNQLFSELNKAQIYAGLFYFVLFLALAYTPLQFLLGARILSRSWLARRLFLVTYPLYIAFMVYVDAVFVHVIIRTSGDLPMLSYYHNVIFYVAAVYVLTKPGVRAQFEPFLPAPPPSDGPGAEGSSSSSREI